MRRGVMAYEVNGNWVTDGDHHALPIYMLDIPEWAPVHMLFGGMANKSQRKEPLPPVWE